MPTAPALPADRPRYLMGVGTPDDLVGAVARGIDMFDCVLPTRSGRHGQAFTRFGTINMRNARHAEDPRRSTRKAAARRRATIRAPICIIWSEAGEMLGAMLLSWHNLAYYQDLMAGRAPPSPPAAFPILPPRPKNNGPPSATLTSATSIGPEGVRFLQVLGGAGPRTT